MSAEDYDAAWFASYAERTMQHVLDVYSRRLNVNLDRVDRLLGAYQQLTMTSQLIADDLIRAIVVLVHATLEDFLRSLATERLPLAPEKVLNGIPLVGSESKTAGKYMLGQLVGHRAKRVDDVIRESVREHLDRSSYNSPDNIVQALAQMSVRADGLDKYYSRLGEMMKRRHLIVHQADLLPPGSPSEGKPRAINDDNVRIWIEAVRDFTREVLSRVAQDTAEQHVQAVKNLL